MRRLLRRDQHESGDEAERTAGPLVAAAALFLLGLGGLMVVIPYTAPDSRSEVFITSPSSPQVLGASPEASEWVEEKSIRVEALASREAAEARQTQVQDSDSTPASWTNPPATEEPASVFAASGGLSPLQQLTEPDLDPAPDPTATPTPTPTATETPEPTATPDVTETPDDGDGDEGDDAEDDGDDPGETPTEPASPTGTPAEDAETAEPTVTGTATSTPEPTASPSRQRTFPRSPGTATVEPEPASDSSEESSPDA